METTKRVYSKPTIVKVKLNHEQAILAACVTRTSSPSDGSDIFCTGSGGACRRKGRGQGTDSTNAS